MNSADLASCPARARIPSMRRIHLLGVLMLAGLLFLSSTPTRAQSPAPVLAYYYAWWSPEAVGPGKSPDWPNEGYHSWDTGVIAQHVAQAAGAGIDGLIVAWYGPTEFNNQTETNFRVILDQASANGITALLSVDLGSAAWFTSQQELVDGLRYALDVHAAHPAYFRLNGKPVLYFWFQGRYSMEQWAAIRAEVDPNHTSIWLAEGAALDTMPIFDGLYMYTISWAENPAGTLAQWGNSTRARGGVWAATAMPGWDNTYTQQSEKYIRDRANGAFYRQTFSGAAASAPDMIVITSWNEWWEGTHIEPSAAFGSTYLDLTRTLISEYKGSGAVAGGGAAPPPIQPTAEPPSDATPDDQPTVESPSSDSTQSPTEDATAAPTITLPPTVTPTPLVTATAEPSVTPSLTAVAVSEVDTLDDPVAESVPETASESASLGRTERLLIGGAVAVAIVGFAMIVGVFVAYWRR